MTRVRDPISKILDQMSVADLVAAHGESAGIAAAADRTSVQLADVVCTTHLLPRSLSRLWLEILARIHPPGTGDDKAQPVGDVLRGHAHVARDVKAPGSGGVTIAVHICALPDGY